MLDISFHQFKDVLTMAKKCVISCSNHLPKFVSISYTCIIKGKPVIDTPNKRLRWYLGLWENRRHHTCSLFKKERYKWHGNSQSCLNLWHISPTLNLFTRGHNFVMLIASKTKLFHLGDKRQWVMYVDVFIKRKQIILIT